MKKWKKGLAVGLASVLAAGALAGCGSSSGSGSSSETASSDVELNLFIWTEYVPDSVITAFT